MESLEQTIHVYGKAIRWGNFELASTFRRAPGADSPEGGLENLERIRVTHYEPVRKTVSEDASSAVVTVEIKYYDTDSLRVVTLVDEQRWRYDLAEKRWYLVGGLPAFK